MAPDDRVLEPPYYPIVYVRGYAFSQRDVNAATDDPYMGFNRGATKLRREEYAEVERFVFEGPVIRLMKDYSYRDVYADGTEALTDIPARSIVIYRYYEIEDTDIGRRSPDQIVLAAPTPEEVMAQRAQGLGDLIVKIRDGVCQSSQELEQRFRVHLVAHSMGGLICRCLLQKYADKILNAQGESMVEKVFTYATPHNGVEILGWNRIVPAYFQRRVMAEYLGLINKEGEPLFDRVDFITGPVIPDRVFCLVGTNWMDYSALAGLAVGEGSDGLVKIENATVIGAREARVHRSHSGPHGIVNSEEGYQNLARFLFGYLALEGRLVIDQAPEPPHGSVSYYVETTVAAKGSSDANLTEQKKDHFSAARQAAESFGDEGPALFCVSFPLEGPHSESTITVDLAVSASVPSNNRAAHLPNQFLFRKSILLEVSSQPRGIRYLFDDKAAYGQRRLRAVEPKGDPPAYSIDLRSPNGFRGRLVLRLTADYESLSRMPREGRGESNTGTAKTAPKPERVGKEELVEETASR